ncbi:MAG: choloylglycine hydrolase family protein [Bacilli bacterium]|nr:choloylglycine hydrolase family protein [Bacilli bacterium]
MCTAMFLQSKSKEAFFGRTMDFSYEISPEVYVVPKDYEWLSLKSNLKIKNKYRFIGTGQDTGNILFADGANEKGLGVATLYFSEYAYYDEEIKTDKVSIAHIELVSYLLGNCASVEEVIKALSFIHLFGITDEVTNSVAPLHWIIADKHGNCIVVESTKAGVKIYNNPIGVLANSPNFPWHLTNLRNYYQLSPIQLERRIWGNLILTPFGQGAGTFGLPGDFTPPSRFVRLSYIKSFIMLPITNEETLVTCFNAMNSITIPKGVVITKNNTFDYTKYTVFTNLTTGDYYFNTYLNPEIKKKNIFDNNSDKILSLGKLF